MDISVLLSQIWLRFSDRVLIGRSSGRKNTISFSSRLTRSWQRRCLGFCSRKASSCDVHAPACNITGQQAVGSFRITSWTAALKLCLKSTEIVLSEYIKVGGGHLITILFFWHIWLPFRKCIHNFPFDVISASSKKLRIFHPADRTPLIKQQSFVCSNL